VRTEVGGGVGAGAGAGAATGAGGCGSTSTVWVPGRDTHPAINRAPTTGTTGRCLLLGIQSDGIGAAGSLTRELRTGQTVQTQLFTSMASPRVQRFWPLRPHPVRQGSRSSARRLTAFYLLSRLGGRHLHRRISRLTWVPQVPEVPRVPVVLNPETPRTCRSE